MSSITMGIEARKKSVFGKILQSVYPGIFCLIILCESLYPIIFVLME